MEPEFLLTRCPDTTPPSRAERLTAAPHGPSDQADLAERETWSQTELQNLQPTHQEHNSEHVFKMAHVLKLLETDVVLVLDKRGVLPFL